MYWTSNGLSDVTDGRIAYWIHNDEWGRGVSVEPLPEEIPEVAFRKIRDIARDQAGDAILLIDCDRYCFGGAFSWYNHLGYLSVHTSDPPWLVNAWPEIRTRVEGDLRSRAALGYRSPVLPWLLTPNHRPSLKDPLNVPVGYTSRRAAPDTGQSVIAGISFRGMFGEACYWCAWVLCTLGCVRGVRRGLDLVDQWSRFDHAFSQGMCFHCGYSVDRAWQKVCPECGESTDAAAGAGSG